MGAIARHHDLSHLPAVARWLQHADGAKATNASRQYNSDQERIADLIRENVIAQLANLQTHPSVALALSQQKLRVHGWVYNIESGQIDALDSASGKFVELSEHPDVAALAGGQKIA